MILTVSLLYIPHLYINKSYLMLTKQHPQRHEIGRKSSKDLNPFRVKQCNGLWICPVLPVLPVLPCPALPCPALPCPALSCPALSCPVLSCPVLSCHVLSCPVLSWLVLSCPVLSCPVLSCPVLSCPVLSCPVLSCPVLSGKAKVLKPEFPSPKPSSLKRPEPQAQATRLKPYASGCLVQSHTPYTMSHQPSAQSHWTHALQTLRHKPQD